MSETRERALLDQLANDLATALESAIGGPVEIGLRGSWHDEEITGRSVPLRAAVVEFGEPLADCVLLLSNHRDDQLRTAAAAAGLAIVQSLDAPADVGMPEVHELTDHEDALDQLDALYGEPTLHFVCGRGDLLVMVGSSLVAAALALQAGGEQSPEDEEMLELAGAFDFDAPGLRRGGAVAHGGRARDGAPAESPTGSHPHGGDGSALEQQPVASAAHAGIAATASENALAASTPMSERWASMLSMVDVELSAELGSTHLCLGDITGLTGDSVLTLDQTADDPLVVFVNGSPYATARLVVVGDEYGIEIVEVMAAGTADGSLLAA